MTKAEESSNKATSTVRQVVEWDFGRIISDFAFLDFKENQKIMLQAMPRLIRVATLLTNSHACMYGNQVSSYFRSRATKPTGVSEPCKALRRSTDLPCTMQLCFYCVKKNHYTHDGCHRCQDGCQASILHQASHILYSTPGSDDISARERTAPWRTTYPVASWIGPGTTSLGGHPGCSRQRH